MTILEYPQDVGMTLTLYGHFQGFQDGVQQNLQLCWTLSNPTNSNSTATLLALLDPIAMSSHVDSVSSSFRRLPLLMEVANVRRMAAATTQSHNIGCFYVVDWCPCPVPSAAGFRLLHRLGTHMQGSLPHKHCLQVTWQPSILHSSVLGRRWPGKLAAFEAHVCKL